MSAAPSASRCCHRADAERSWRTRSSHLGHPGDDPLGLGRRASASPLGLDRQGDVVGEVGELAAGVGEGVRRAGSQIWRCRASNSASNPDSASSTGSPWARATRWSTDDTASSVDVLEPVASRWARLRSISAARVVLQVGLGHHAHRRRAALAGGDGERQLGRGQLLGAVGDEHDAVGGVEAGQVERSDRRVEPADAGHVDEVQPGRQQSARERHVDASEAEVVALVALLARDVGEAGGVERCGLASARRRT